MSNNRDVASLALLFCSSVIAAGVQAAGTGVLGTPVNGSKVSGVSVISGYHCTSSNIEVFIDGVSIGKAGAGTTLPSTSSVCGHAQTGYSLLYNYNNLNPGQHTVAAYADGDLIASHNITTLQSGGTAWLSGANHSMTLAGFPQAGKTATVEWVQSMQNFMVTQIADGTNINASSLAGSYNQTYIVKGSGSCSGTKLTSTIFNVNAADDDVTIQVTYGTVPCTYNLSVVGGDATSGFDLTGTYSCSGGFSGTTTVTNIRNVSGHLTGTIIDQSSNGCIETLSFM